MRLARAAVLKVRALILAGLSVESAPRRRGNFLYDLIIFFFKYRVIYISLFLTGKKWAGQALRRLEKSARGFTIRAGVRLMRGGRPDSMNGEIARGFSTEGLFVFFQNVEVIPK